MPITNCLELCSTINKEVSSLDITVAVRFEQVSTNAGSPKADPKDRVATRLLDPLESLMKTLHDPRMMINLANACQN
jgi:hypothetical protein